MSLKVKRLVVKFSGRLVSPPRASYLAALREVISDLIDKVELIGIVVGGGAIARDYIRALRELGISESLLDEVGIAISRVNALTIAEALYPMTVIKVPESIREALSLLSFKKVVVLGGLQPGQSTNAVAASLADAMNADILINMLSDVDGIYRPAPGVPGAVKLGRVSCQELNDIIKNAPQVAGSYELFDHIAMNIVLRSRIPVYFVNGSDPTVIADVLEGRAEGTMVYC